MCCNIFSPLYIHILYFTITTRTKQQTHTHTFLCFFKEHNSRELFVCFPGIKVIVTAIYDKPEKRTETMPGSTSRRNDVGYILVQSFKMYFSVCVCRSFFFICQSRNEGSSASPLTRKLAGHHIRVVAATPPKQQQHPPTK